MADSTAGLDELARRVFAELELCAAAPAPNFERSRGAGRPGSRAPSGGDAPHLRLRDRYRSARTEAAKRAVIADALAELRRTRYSPDAAASRDDWRVTVASDPRPAAVVAEEECVSVRTVRRARAWARAKGYVRAAV